MSVAGWWDQEDFYGPMKIYELLEQHDVKGQNYLVVNKESAFDVLRTHRLEARAAICNGRGNGAMKKLGAEREGVLRHAFFRNGDYVDQVVWSILHEDWKRRRQDKAIWGSSVIH